MECWQTKNECSEEVLNFNTLGSILGDVMKYFNSELDLLLLQLLVFKLKGTSTQMSSCIITPTQSA